MISGSVARSLRVERVSWTCAAAASAVLLVGCTASVSSGGPGADADRSPTTPSSQVSAVPEPASLIESVPTSTAPPSTARPSTTPPTTTVAPPETVEPTVDEPVAIIYQPAAPLAIPALEIPLDAVGQSDGEATVRLQARLLELGFWVQSTDGDYGLTTSQAVMAAQKYYGVAASGALDEATAEVLSNAVERASGMANAGTLVEIDKSKQLLFLVVDGVTTWIVNTSTGSEVPYEAPNEKDPTKIERGDAVTPVGLHHVNRERPDGWWEGDLGEIYRPKYFVGGIAIHGSNSIPNYPASHGCVRVSVPAMDWIWEFGLVPIETPVWVHGNVPAA